MGFDQKALHRKNVSEQVVFLGYWLLVFRRGLTVSEKGGLVGFLRGFLRFCTQDGTMKRVVWFCFPARLSDILYSGRDSEQGGLVLVLLGFLSSWISFLPK